MENSERFSVYEPPVCTADMPGTGGTIGREPEDFRVDEIPAYSPTGEGEHRYVRIEKRLMTTPEAVRIIAEAAGVEPRDIGYAGLKDKQGVTTQWLSLPRKSAEPEQWVLPAGLRILESSFHGNKLRTGHLSGNRFAINIVDVGADASDRARALLDRLTSHGVPNYFGAQRFGRGGENVPRALEWIRQGARRRLSSFLLKLYPSVVQAEVFNRYLTLRQDAALAPLLNGEVVRLEGSGAVFCVEDAAQELPRLERREIHRTGPMLGPKMRPARDEPARLEAEAMRAVSLEEAALETLARFAPGTRRDLLVYPQEARFTADGPRLRLEFALPAGSYATVLVREFTRAPFLAQDERLDEVPA